MRPGEVEQVVLARARQQHGVISSAQLAHAGASPGWIGHRVNRGWLRRLHRGVYLVGPLDAPHARSMAATLAAGSGALVSHYPAAVLWDLLPPNEDPIDVTIAGRDRRSRPGIRTHIVSTLHSADVSRRHGIPVTSAARTLLDLAATSTTREL